MNVYWSLLTSTSIALYPFYTGNWLLYTILHDNDNHIFRSTKGAGQAILTFLGGLKSNTISLNLTDIAHHHLSIGILFVWASHVYLSLSKGYGHSIRNIFQQVQ
jgi:photosystem I P700 chlorophyll a apoprotein A2